MRFLMRQPALHFVVLGAAIWLLSLYLEDRASRQIQAPSAAQITELVADWSARNGRMADSEVRAALVREEIERRLLFAEALRLGLHEHDPVVLGRLYQDAVFLGIDAPQDQLIETALELELHRGDDLIRQRLLERMRTLAVGPLPTASDEQLTSVFEQHRSEFSQPARVSFEQRFLRPDDSSETAWAQARQRAEQALIDGPQQADSDPFLHGSSFEKLGPRELKDTFGGALPQALMDVAATKEGWFGPVASHYGWHLLRVTAYEPARPAELENVRAQVVALWQDQLRRQRLSRYIQTLRQRYRITS